MAFYLAFLCLTPLRIFTLFRPGLIHSISPAFPTLRLPRPTNIPASVHACVPSARLLVGAPLYESQLLRTSCSRSCRRHPQSGLSSSLRIPACPTNIRASVHARVPSARLLVGAPLYESQLLRTSCSRSCRRHPQSGLSSSLRIPACPTNIRASVHARVPSARLLVGAFYAIKMQPDGCMKSTLCIHFSPPPEL